MKKILCLAPHPDDGEIGCGGTLAKLREDGHEVYYVVLSNCNESLRSEFPPGTLMRELVNATRIIGIPAHNIIKLDYKVRHFPKWRQSILEDFTEIRKDIDPEIVFMPSGDDMHQDHHTVYEEGLRAFKKCNIFCYEMPWNMINFRATAFSQLTEKHVFKKTMSIGEYYSQSHRDYKSDMFAHLARVRGAQSGYEYAEAFDAIRVRI